MTSNTIWRRLIVVTACLISTAVASCSTDSPTQSRFQRLQADVVVDTDGNSHTLLDGQIPSVQDSAEAWIDQSGGYVYLDGGKKNGRQTGHFLYVPEHAVKTKTLFR